MKRIAAFLLSVFLSVPAFSQKPLDQFFSQSDDFLHEYVRDGMVDYQKVKTNFDEIKGLYEQIGTMDLALADENEAKAFYVNAYNLIVIYQVSKYYPLKSALDQSGFFDKVSHTVAGRRLTLNALEIGIINRKYKDPRTHFALACAAKGCPPLSSFAYLPKKLDEQLEERTKMALNSDYFIRLKPAQNKAEVSKIFDWYEKDFTQTGMTVKEYINKYRRKEIPASYEIGYYEYDWSLNEQKRS